MFSSARYISGYYDERAVDLFFNEVKVAATQKGSSDTASLFETAVKNPGTDQSIEPLTPDEQHGAFLMILSTNASSVSSAIGQFAENQVVADAVTNLANRDVILSSMQASHFTAVRATAAAEELRRLFALLPKDDGAEREEVIRAFVRILNSIAQALQTDTATLSSLGKAEAWFARLQMEEP